MNHLINSRELSTLNPIEQELNLNPQKNYLFELPYIGAISVYGDRAIEFLQGQLTADITKVNDINMTQAAQCNLKGRVLSLMDVVSWQGIKLLVPTDILENTMNSLTKSASLSKVTLEQNTHFVALGFYLQNPKDMIPNCIFLPKEPLSKADSDHFCYYHLGNGHYIILANKETAENLINQFAARQQLAGSLTWHTMQLKAGRISIYPESRGLFLPHRLDLHQTKILSFDKGCYKGQEIIARMHYRASIKHEMKLYTTTTSNRFFSGQKIYKIDQDVELGELVDFSYLNDKTYLLAISLLKNAPIQLRFEQHDTALNLNEYI